MNAVKAALVVNMMREGMDKHRAWGIVNAAFALDSELRPDVDVLAEHSGGDRREWVTAGAWLYKGDALAVINSRPVVRKNEPAA
jgi:hypothetical protein